MKKFIFFFCFFLAIFLVYRNYFATRKNYELKLTDTHRETWENGIAKSALLQEYFKLKKKLNNTPAPYLKISVNTLSLTSGYKTTNDVKFSITEILGASGEIHNEVYKGDFSYVLFKTVPEAIDLNLRKAGMSLWESLVASDPALINYVVDMVPKLAPSDAIALLQTVSRIKPPNTESLSPKLESLYYSANSYGLKVQLIKLLLEFDKKNVDRGRLSEILLDACFNQDKELQTLARNNITGCGEYAIEELIKKLNNADTSADDKVYALQALWMFKEKARDVLPYLPTLANSISIKLQMNAYKTYGHIGDRRSDIIKLLKGVLLNSNNNVHIRSAAWFSLLVLRSPWQVSYKERHTKPTYRSRRSWRYRSSPIVEIKEDKFLVVYKPDNVWVKAVGKFIIKYVDGEPNNISFEKAIKGGKWDVKDLELHVRGLTASFNTPEKFIAIHRAGNGDYIYWSAKSFCDIFGKK